MGAIAYAGNRVSGTIVAMPSDKSDTVHGNEILILNSVYKNPESIFSFRPSSLSEIKATATIVLDTNVLLVPFKTGKESLAQIEKVYEALISEKRLVIPGQVAREFARNRSERLKEIYQQISKKRIGLGDATYPMLENSPKYREMKKIEGDLLAKIKEHTRAIDSLLEEIRGWHWNDPVSALYQKLFGSGVVLDASNRSEREVSAEIERRYAHDLPPGYKDKGKADRGVGDYLIWSTILEIGKSRSVDTIFVSADRKSDWWIQSEGSPLYPRFELIEEYRHVTDGKNIHIIDFATLLGMFGATKEVVAEVKSKEVPLPPVDQAKSKMKMRRRHMMLEMKRTANAVVKWLLGRPGVNDVRLIDDKHRQLIFQVDGDSHVTFGKVFVGYQESIADWGDVRELMDAAEIEMVFGRGAEVVLVFRDSISAQLSDLTVERMMASPMKVKVYVGVVQRDGVLELISY